MIMIAILVFAIVIAGSIGVWYYTKVLIPLNTIAENQKVLRQQLNKLQPVEVEEEEEVVEEEEIEYPVTLTQKNINKYVHELKVIDREDMKELFMEDANTTVKYSNKVWGIEFNVPFNENWGDENYLVEPFEEREGQDDEKVILFGKFVAQEGGYGREFIIYVKPFQTVDELLEFAKIEQRQSGGDRDPLSPPAKKTINSHVIIEFPIHGLNDPYYKYIVGEKYNYNILHLPQDIPVDEDPEIREIIKSIKFIK